MRIAWLMALLAFLLPGAAALAAPDIVARSEQGMREACRAGGGQAAAKPALVTEIDLNGDGLPDYIVDGNRMDCRGGMPTICGASGGCLAEIFMSGAGGYQRVFQDNVYGFRIDRSRQPPGLRVAWHKFHCDRTGPEGCIQPLVWNGRQLVVGGAPAQAAPPQAQGARPAPTAAGAPWAVRVTNNVPMAFAPGQDPLRELVVVCSNAGRPFLGVVFLKPPAFGHATMTIGVAARRFDVRAVAAPGNSNVFLADLFGTELLAALPQARDPITIAMNGTALGTVAGAGAAASMGAALGPCQRR